MRDTIEWVMLPALVLLIVAGLLFGGLTAASFAWDCDAIVERWEAQRTECEARGGHWRGQPVEEFCDGALMIAPRGECWSEVELRLGATRPE